MANSTKKRASGFKRLPRGPNGGIQLLADPVGQLHLGKQGDVVEVRPGYAYNYLLPQGLATIASPHHLRMIDKAQEPAWPRSKSRAWPTCAILAKEIERQSLTIEANANDEGHLYGSVGARQRSSAPSKQHNFNITTDQVKLEGPLRELGLYTVKIHLHAQIDAELKVWVVPTVTAEEEAKPAKKDEAKAPAQK
jgi:large subunit ribosomal protein L9